MTDVRENVKRGLEPPIYDTFLRICVCRTHVPCLAFFECCPACQRLSYMREALAHSSRFVVHDLQTWATNVQCEPDSCLRGENGVFYSNSLNPTVQGVKMLRRRTLLSAKLETRNLTVDVLCTCAVTLQSGCTFRLGK